MFIDCKPLSLRDVHTRLRLRDFFHFLLIQPLDAAVFFFYSKNDFNQPTAAEKKVKRELQGEAFYQFCPRVDTKRSRFMEIQQRRELWSEEGERRLLKREWAFSFQHFSLFATLWSHLQTVLWFGLFT